MCGFYEFDASSTQGTKLIKDLAVDQQLPLFRKNNGLGPASSVDIIITKDDKRCVVPAIWWLLLDGQLKPSKYTSFNTRSDKLQVKKSAGFLPYRKSRCILPATAIVEGEGAKGKRVYHHIAQQHTAFALGGLYREWIHQSTGEVIYSCSVITLAPHPKWQGIHSKSTPLFLPQDEPNVIDKWLDPSFDQIEEFQSLLLPSFREPLIVTPIDRPSTRNPLGESFRI